MNRLQHSDLTWILLLLIAIVMVFPCPAQAQSPEIEDAISQQNWSKSESLLLRFLLNQTSGPEAFSAALALSRASIQLHKAPQAMEWLEVAGSSVHSQPEKEMDRKEMLQNLQRIYLTRSGYQHDPAFTLHGVELDGPTDLVISAENELTILDRYRLVVLAEKEPGQFYPIPPTTPLPEDARSLKLLDNTPVVVTRYGFWNIHRVKYFGTPEKLSRIIDAVFTIDNQWLVIDRRNSSMLKFDTEGHLLNKTPIPTLSGDEKITKNIFGGCWVLHPASRTIFTAGADINIQIPFRGPGYKLEDPVDIVSDNFGHLFVLCENKTVTIFSPSGIRLRIVDLDPENRILRDVRGISVSKSGKIFIADRKNHAVYCYK